MKEAEIRFAREGVTGIIPVGTYLVEAARRIGIRFVEPCNAAEGVHHCEVQLTAGADLLSIRTAAEQKYFEEREVGPEHRLACQAKIEKEGEIEVKTKESETAKEEKKAETEEEYRKRFSELPLDKKISELVQLEAIALSDTLSFVFNSPYTLGDKIMGVMAQFGFKKEEREREAAKPEEHRSNGDAGGPEAEAAPNDEKTKE
jgi:ferredoxin